MFCKQGQVQDHDYLQQSTNEKFLQLANFKGNYSNVMFEHYGYPER